jgi:hypothetical protein
MIADELRRQADEFIDLVNLAGKIGRDPNQRADRAQRFQDRLPATSSETGGREEDRLSIPVFHALALRDN